MTKFTSLALALSLAAVTVSGCAVGEQMKADWQEHQPVESAKQDASDLWDALVEVFNEAEMEVKDKVDELSHHETVAKDV